MRRMLLPVLLVGKLPTTQQAQRISATVKAAAPADRPRVVQRLIEDL